MVLIYKTRHTEISPTEKLAQRISAVLEAKDQFNIIFGFLGVRTSLQDRQFNVAGSLDP